MDNFKKLEEAYSNDKFNLKIQKKNAMFRERNFKIHRSNNIKS